MNRKPQGFINGSVLTLLIFGLVLFGLLVYGAQSGQELPLWPAILVCLVNLFAATKVIMAVRKSKQQRAETPPDQST